ncbi:hypothetical protein ASZ90_016871 [hydrocarbon metagenome]|uniref:Uncharacterized protein n=1 Tax=hydrocarbon metagenome TaxID=938273 RepID=A0A0W8EAV7_9ZZZZ
MWVGGRPVLPLFLEVILSLAQLSARDGIRVPDAGKSRIRCPALSRKGDYQQI